MTPSAPTSPPPKWIFFAMDAVLLATAWFIADRSAQPLTTPALFAIVGCVLAGVIVGTIPLLVSYERQKNATLDERQRELEALSQTLAAAAEQIGIAAAGLHQIVEVAQKNLRHADQLPHRLQDKMAEFQSLLANANDAEKEELEKELTALRTSESERLETISDKIAKSAADWAKLESTTQKNLAAAQEAAAKISTHASNSIARAAADLEEKLRSALAQFEARLASPDLTAKSGPALVEFSPPATIAASVEAHIEELPPVKPQQIVPVAPGTRSPYTDPAIPVSPGENTSPPPAPPATIEIKVSRKRPARKTPADPALDLPLSDAPVTAQAPAPSADSEFSQISPEEAAPAASIAADGATRLIVTAYIGIGNRLFIRGAGPGLSWEKGVPLQFVSIGKWRWETSHATASVAFKLYKNDEIECASLGEQSLNPGYQHEFTAAF